MDGGACWAAVYGVAKSRARLSDFTFTFHFHALKKEMATHSSVLAWRIPGTREPGGLPSMGSHRVGHDWSDLAAAAAVAPRHVESSQTRDRTRVPCTGTTKHWWLFPLLALKFREARTVCLLLHWWIECQKAPWAPGTRVSRASGSKGRHPRVMFTVKGTPPPSTVPSTFCHIFHI